jgi:hypothetical protein
MSYKEFEDKNIVKEKGFSWEVEKDEMDWEHALEGITKEFISKNNPPHPCPLPPGERGLIIPLH